MATPAFVEYDTKNVHDEILYGLNPTMFFLLYMRLKQIKLNFRMSRQ